MEAVPPNTVLHATTVALKGHAVVITGPSGAGKSSLALQLIALGAQLVSDDRTILRVNDGVLWAEAPEAITGLIEARGVGLLPLPPCGPARVALVVDLSKVAHARLPEPQTETLCGITFPCLHHAPSPHFAAAVLLCLAGVIGDDA